MIRFGPAGWEYPDWGGVVYPRPAPRGFDRLAFLAGFFDVVEVNATFYRPFQAADAARWAERVGENPRFRFAVKVHRRFTHERETPFLAAEVEEARVPLDALAREGRLGAALLQFPWSFRRTPEAEEWLAAVFRAFAGMPLALEVRHASWDAPDFLEALAGAGVGIVNVDQPMFAGSIAPGARVTAPVAYVRVHGRNWKDWFREGAGRDARYDYLYSAAELRPWAARIEALDGSARAPDVYVVTNNHFRGQAVANAKMLEGMVRRRRVEAPPGVLAAYPDALGPWAREPAPGPLFR